jgi:hypothetical protein
LQNHENIKNCTYLLPAAMPGNNSEPKTWEIIMGEYKAEKQQFQTMSTNMQRTPAFVLCGNLAVSTRIAKTCLQKSTICWASRNTKRQRSLQQ